MHDRNELTKLAEQFLRLRNVELYGTKAHVNYNVASAREMADFIIWLRATGQRNEEAK